MLISIECPLWRHKNYELWVAREDSLIIDDTKSQSLFLSLKRARSVSREGFQQAEQQKEKDKARKYEVYKKESIHY